jgi:hypothetical protein
VGVENLQIPSPSAPYGAERRTSLGPSRPLSVTGPFRMTCLVLFDPSTPADLNTDCGDGDGIHLAASDAHGCGLKDFSEDTCVSRMWSTQDVDAHCGIS